MPLLFFPILPFFMIGLQGGIFLTALVLLVYLGFRRMRISKEEDFQKRDN